MAKLAKFNEIVRDFNDLADFVIIYISEAHANDGWAFKVSTTGSMHLVLVRGDRLILRLSFLPIPLYFLTAM